MPKRRVRRLHTLMFMVDDEEHRLVRLAASAEGKMLCEFCWQAVVLYARIMTRGLDELPVGNQLQKVRKSSARSKLTR
jgi:hypothetical protein